MSVLCKRTVAIYINPSYNILRERKSRNIPKEYFDVILCDVGASKIEVVRVLKEITGLGLKEVKALVDAAPVAIRERVSEAQAIAVKCRLESVGATVELK